MADATPSELLARTVTAFLEEGPTPVAALVDRLDELGLLEHLREDGVLEAEMEDAVIDEVLVSDAIWSTSAGVLALSEQLTDGMVLTHRLTTEEIELGEVPVTPDLVILDWDADDGLDLDGGGCLVHSSGLRVPEEDFSVLVGPEGWLDGFRPGTLLGFSRAGRSVRVEPVQTLAPDDHEAGLLRTAADGLIGPDRCEEAHPLILDTMVADRSAFRRPVRPLGELLAAAGLERRGFSFGRAGERWQTRSELYREGERDRAAEAWGFDSCCEEAFESVQEAFASFCARPDDAALDVRALARALSHGAVAPAIAQQELGDRAGGDEHLLRFADRIVAGAPRQAAAARLLIALEAERRGEALAAEAALRLALREDPDYGPAASELAMYELDRGELGRAVSLLRHSDLTSDDPTLDVLEDAQAEIDAPYRGVGRNDRCPCGSGRKFKTCCLANRRVPSSARTGLLMHRLALFAGRDRRRSTLIGLASSACDPDDPELLSRLTDMARDPLITDFALFEGGVAQEYLDERGALLLDDERDLLAQLVEERRRLWEVVEVDPGNSLTLRDTATGDRLEVSEHLGSQGRSEGELMLARVARLADQNQLIGVPLEIPLRLRDSTLHLVDSDPDADMLASWYGDAIAFPRMVNTENDPLLLCRAELATDAELSDLHAALDGVLERGEGSGEGAVWSDLWTKPGGDQILRGTVRYEDGGLHLDTNSAARLERLLHTVRGAVPDAALILAERTDPRDALAQPRESLETSEEVIPPAVESAVDELVQRKEAEWVDETIPALAGLTPRQALDDPTRREDLFALLREMERAPVPAGARGFDAARLRKLLGLGPPR